jgi:hypothetical protein
MKLGDIVYKRRDHRKDHAFQRMPVGIIMKKTVMDPEHFPQAHTTFKIKWFKTDRFWKTWFLENELVLITKPLEVWQKSDVVR